MGIALAVVGSSAVASFRPRFTRRVWCLLLPAYGWMVALAVVPNKWLGYAVTLTVLIGLGGYALLNVRLGIFQPSPRWMGVLLILTILLNISALGHVWAQSSGLRASVVQELHEVIPAGARVLIPFREWYGFVGRNPIIGLEGRSLPMFRTSLVQSANEFDAEYAVLVRNSKEADSPYFWVTDGSNEWADFLRTRTKLVRVIDAGLDGVIEVRRVAGDLSGVY